ncbi:MAG: phospholipid carrier-dependent glycosyltransferase [Armatimonadota bacterium]|nr:phospholipid carrier-dependent glycosyltransferase [Armatimonadota bacterium]
MSTWSRADWVALAAVVGVAALLRLAGLGHPAAFVFDETFYVPAACRLALGPQPECGGPSPADVHPPLGKWLIALGIAVFGFNPVGWRISAAVAGTLTVGLLFVTARWLLRSTLSATIAASLLALDFLHFVHSRIGMLDAFLVLFTVAVLACWSLDREDSDPDHRTVRTRFWHLVRPWRMGAGLATGAAIATKWSGAFVAATAIVLTLLVELPRIRRSPDGRAGRQAPTVASVALWLVAVPLLVYTLTHIGTVGGRWLAWPWAEDAWLRAIVDEQVRLARLHPAVGKTHPLRSAPWQWLFSPPPLPYFVQRVGETTFATIQALGTPAWGPGVIALAVVAGRAVRHTRAASLHAALLVAFGLTYLPWFGVARIRTVFLFHFLPTVPILYLLMAAALTPVPRRPATRAGLVALAAAMPLAFGMFRPVLTAAPLAYTACCRSVATFVIRSLPDCALVSAQPLPLRDRADPC